MIDQRGLADDDEMTTREVSSGVAASRVPRASVVEPVVPSELGARARPPHHHHAAAKSTGAATSDAWRPSSAAKHASADWTSS